MYHGKLLRTVGTTQVFSQSRSRQQMEWNSSWKYWMLSPRQVGGSIKTASGRSRFVSHEYARGSIHSLDLCMDAQAHKSRKPPAWFPSSRIIASRSPFCPRPVQLPDESHECRPRLQAAMEEPDWNHERATSTHITTTKPDVRRKWDYFMEQEFPSIHKYQHNNPYLSIHNQRKHPSRRFYMHQKYTHPQWQEDLDLESQIVDSKKVSENNWRP